MKIKKFIFFTLIICINIFVGKTYCPIFSNSGFIEQVKEYKKLDQLKPLEKEEKKIIDINAPAPEIEKAKKTKEQAVETLIKAREHAFETLTTLNKNASDEIAISTPARNFFYKNNLFPSNITLSGTNAINNFNNEINQQKNKLFTQIVGAGVLPYARNPVDGKLYILFARETNIKGKPNKQFPTGENLWGDFGGAPDKGEDPAATASREFAEESIDLFDKKVISNLLTIGDPKVFMKATLSTKQEGGFGPPYISYFVPIAYNSSINDVFLAKRKIEKDSHKLEKDILQWVPIDLIKKAINSGNKVITGPSIRVNLRFPAFNALKNSADIINNLN